MKKILGTTAAAIALTVLLANSQPAQEVGTNKEKTNPFMRAKLIQCQNVLEGLTIEDFAMIAKGAQEMSSLSRDNQWQVLQTSEYIRRSTDFRREADALSEAARMKNLDAAMLAYIKVTMSCVECHKYVRSIRKSEPK